MMHIASIDTATSDLVSILLGITLSAACGFRVFVPLFMVSLFSVLGHWSLPAGLSWLDSEQSLIMLAVASAIEVIAYYVPWLDNLLDTIATPMAAAVGTFITAASVPADMNPMIQWTLAVIAGGGSAGLIKGLTSVFRLGSSATTGGLANPIISTLELVTAATLPFLAMTIPVVSGLLILGLFLVFGNRFKTFWLSRSY
ncbi:MAG: DUF4126 domain-containing protein [Cyanobacteriota bacterium ELA615]|jgi:hypothetical protein